MYAEKTDLKISTTILALLNFFPMTHRSIAFWEVLFLTKSVGNQFKLIIWVLSTLNSFYNYRFRDSKLPAKEKKTQSKTITSKNIHNF